jgi:hypothetical protein
MSMTLIEFLKDIEKRSGKEMATKAELAIDGCLYREPASVISRYTGFSIKGILTLKKNIRTDNNLDYFSI